MNTLKILPKIRSFVTLINKKCCDKQYTNRYKFKCNKNTVITKCDKEECISKNKTLDTCAAIFIAGSIVELITFTPLKI
jgi:hypothetical protein